MSDVENETELDIPSESGADWILQDLVLAADEGSEMAVTLFLSGMVVSGRIVSGQRYLELMAEQMTPDEEGMPRLFQDYSGVLKNNDREGSGPHFIHLRDASFLMGGAVHPGGNGLLWRGKISEVIGHSLFVSFERP